MSVYVDETKSSEGAVVRRVLMSDVSVAELDAMAASIGVPTTKFNPRTLPHYKLTHGQMRKAVEAGAILHDYNSQDWRAVHKLAAKLPR